MSGFIAAVIRLNGEVQEWLNWHAWKACVPLKGTEGSNPSLSARVQNIAQLFLKMVEFRVRTDPTAGG